MKRMKNLKSTIIIITLYRNEVYIVYSIEYRCNIIIVYMQQLDIISKQENWIAIQYCWFDIKHI